MKEFEKKQIDKIIYGKLKEAEIEAAFASKRYSHEEVFDELRATPIEKTE